MKSNCDFDILVEALLTEMPHIKVGEGRYVDLHLEDIIGNKDALKERIRNILAKYPHVIQRFRINPDILLIVKKHFGMSLLEYVRMLQDLMREVSGKFGHAEIR